MAMKSKFVTNVSGMLFTLAVFAGVLAVPGHGR